MLSGCCGRRWLASRKAIIALPRCFSILVGRILSLATWMRHCVSTGNARRRRASSRNRRRKTCRRFRSSDGLLPAPDDIIGSVDRTSRRTFLSGSGVCLGLAHGIAAADDARLNAQSIRRAPWRVEPAAEGLSVERSWSGEVCKAKLVNNGKRAVRVKQVVLFTLPHGLPADTHLYGESFQMLSQTSGTLARPVDLGYSEPKHYKIPQPEGAVALSGLLTLGGSTTLAFTSCRRFIGRFFLREKTLEVVMDTEGLELGPGQSWELEEFTIASTPANVAARINQNHPPRNLFPAPPTGWCSWYCFGPRVTAQQVLDNLDKIAKDIPRLKYVQIDDGYQPAMGDWLETGKAFGGDVLGG